MPFFFLLFVLFWWPVLAIKFGLKYSCVKPVRGSIAIALALASGIPGYLIMPYRLSIFYPAHPLLSWAFVAIPVAYIAGGLLFCEWVDDEPWISF
jgi:hypothetical protein